MSLHGPRYLRGRTMIVDRVVAVAILVVAAPALAALALVVRLIDGSPVLVCLERMGRHGRTFGQYKVRTMRAAPGGATITAGADPRVTRLGAVLRQYRVDEVPQLINVLKGEMALIGPRPETPDMVDGVGDWPAVLEASPAIAGATQAVFAKVEPLLLVGGNHLDIYRHVVLPRKLRLDRWYVEQASPRIDALIVVATVGAVLGRPMPAALERLLPDVLDGLDLPDDPAPTGG